MLTPLEGDGELPKWRVYSIGVGRQVNPGEITISNCQSDNADIFACTSWHTEGNIFGIALLGRVFQEHCCFEMLDNVHSDDVELAR